MPRKNKKAVPTRRNLFIVIEALDAGGSQTQSDRLVQRLRNAGWRPDTFHFPQEDRATGKLIYEKFLLSKKKDYTRREQALLYIQDFYSRADDMHSILSHKKGRRIIVSDRFCTSTFAYQTIGLAGPAYRKMMTWLTWLCYEGKSALPTPDLVVFIDTPVAISLQRLRGKQTDFFETKQKLTAIRESYLRIAKAQGWRTVSGVDAQGLERTRADIHHEIWQLVLPYL